MDDTASHGERDRHADTHCTNCGGFVTPRFARVFGDNQNRVERCLNCTTSRDLCNGG